MTSFARIVSVVGVLALAACASTPPPPTDPVFDPAALVATVRAAGQAAGTELEVQPLQDPEVESLRQQATQLETRHMYRGAADLLDRALELQAQDAALLQDRAEVALLLKDLTGAEAYARRAIEQGRATGPLCRRHWELLLQAGLLRANDRVIRRGESEAQATARVAQAGTQVRQARAQREACTVAVPNRF